jgi:hypothetical protein
MAHPYCAGAGYCLACTKDPAFPTMMQAVFRFVDRLLCRAHWVQESGLELPLFRSKEDLTDDE